MWENVGMQGFYEKMGMGKGVGKLKVFGDKIEGLWRQNKSLWRQNKSLWRQSKSLWRQNWRSLKTK